MRTSISALILVLSGIVSWLMPVFGLAADTVNHQSIKSKEQTILIDCEMSQSALDAINIATAEFIKQGRQDSEVEHLIDEAKNAAWFPECDSDRAKILADRANSLLGISKENLHAARASIDEKPLVTGFDGAWEFGLNAEFIEQESISSASVLDSLIDDKYGLYVGKELYRTEKWFLGGQLHLVTTNDANIDDSDKIAFDATSLFATARHRALPALQFKVGLSRAKYTNFFEDGSGSGLAYGIGLTTGNDDFRLHWLDYEVHRIGGEKFETISVNLLVVVCIVGVFFGGDCF
jgi:hypothetical protein